MTPRLGHRQGRKQTSNMSVKQILLFPSLCYQKSNQAEPLNILPMMNRPLSLACDHVDDALLLDERALRHPRRLFLVGRHAEGCGKRLVQTRFLYPFS